MKKLLVIGAPLVALSLVGGLILATSQAEGLERGCRQATVALRVIATDIGVGKTEIGIFGASRFSEGSFLADTRAYVRTVEDFPRMAREYWLAGLLGTTPQDMDFWISATSAARAYLAQLENAGLTGDYSNARNFGTEIEAVARDAESRDVCDF
jgi:hypothetical protein